MQTAASEFRINNKDVAFLAAAAAALFAATVIVSPKHPFWYDEIFSWTLVTDASFRHMMYAIAQGAESPPGLYHELARVWLAFTGRSILALRLFSTAAYVVALAAIWTTLRRAFSFHATALGVLTVFCTSSLMLYHSAEARFYPLFVACTALAIAAYASAVTAEKLTWRLAVGVFLANLALVQSHIYGVAYSAALLFALVCCDLAARRFRPLVYACTAAAWLSLIPWLPTFHRINEMTKPRHWIYPPTVSGVLDFYQLYSLELPFILFAVAVLCLVARLLFANQAGSRAARITSAVLLIAVIVGAFLMPGYPGLLDIALLALLIALAGYGVPRPAEDPVRLRHAMLVAAAVLLAAPPAAAIFSILVKPVFISKYVLPSMLGMAILLTWIVENGSRIRLQGRSASILGAVWAGLLITVLLVPLLAAMQESPGQPPASGVSNTEVERRVPFGTPIAVESGMLFFPLEFGTKNPQNPFYYLGDLEAASSPQADPRALINYRGAQMWLGLGYLPRDRAPDWHDFLAHHSSFAVLHSPGHFWFDWRIRSNPEYTWRSAGRIGSEEIYLVEKRATERDTAADLR